MTAIKGGGDAQQEKRRSGPLTFYRGLIQGCFERILFQQVVGQFFRRCCKIGRLGRTLQLVGIRNRLRNYGGFLVGHGNRFRGERSERPIMKIPSPAPAFQ